ncbi:MAG: hypothetical protein KC503_32725 [Myxococcales bacterium]|nr:hypothetical protein [Myxococcales bacterium]
MAYRDEHEALQAQCDNLRRQLEDKDRDVAEQARLRAELAHKLEALEKARTQELARSEMGKQLSSMSLARGVLLGLLACAIALSIYVFVRSAPRRPTPARPAVAAVAGSPAELWFRALRPHCNAVEIRNAIRRRPPPAGTDGQAHLATCYALAGKLDHARAAIDALPARARPQAAGTLFRLIHPVADSGDEVAAGPAMELVIAYQPSNFMAVYHAGMSAHKNGRVERARTLLRRFLTMYNNSNDGWRSRAQRALAEIAARSK